MSEAPSRVAAGSFTLGGWGAFANEYVLDVHLGYELGPLGRKSDAQLIFGGRFVTPSRQWRPGYFGAFRIGAGIGGPAEPNGSNGRSLHAAAGVAWTAFSHNDESETDRYGSILLGVAYHWQDQDDINAGDFLGLELTLAGGGDFWERLQEWQLSK